MLTDTEISSRLKSFICREILRRDDYPLADDEPLISGGLIDSFSLVHISTFIEREFGVRLPDTELDSAHLDTVRAMTGRIRTEMG
jgi:acyl carrier protein